MTHSKGKGNAQVPASFEVRVNGKRIAVMGMQGRGGISANVAAWGSGPGPKRLSMYLGGTDSSDDAWDGCSRALAYEHLRRAARRGPGDRGLLRVPLDVWERYAKEVLSCSGSSSGVGSGTAGSTSRGDASSAPRSAATGPRPSGWPASGSGTPPIPITRPRATGHLVRLFETDAAGGHVPYPLASLRAADVDGYISRRRGEQVADATVAKELVVLRKSLRLAIRAGIWRGRVEEVIPVAFSAGYEPRTRALDAGELAKLLAELLPDRAARAAFIVATSACWRESELARREDVGEGLATVRLRGTRRKTRYRTVPIVSPGQRSLLDYAQEHARGTGGVLFTPWRNARRDLAEACARAGIERCSPNDLRRTFASWQVEAGVPLFPIAQAMGHKDTRMLERVYGRQTPEQLATIMARAMGL